VGNAGDTAEIIANYKMKTETKIKFPLIFLNFIYNNNYKIYKYIKIILRYITL